MLAACGGSEPPSETPAASAPTEPAATAKPADHDHAKLSPELDAFHDILAPRWHSAPGPTRMQDTCSAIAQFRSRGEAVKRANPPAGASATAWSQATADLDKSVAAMGIACDGKDQPSFDSAFTEVHESFHRAMELASSGHGEHEGHGEHHEQGEPGHK